MHNLPCTSSFNHSYKIISLLIAIQCSLLSIKINRKKTKKNLNFSQRKVIHKHMVQKLLRKNDISKLKRIGSMVDNNFHLLSCVQNFNLQFFIYLYLSFDHLLKLTSIEKFVTCVLSLKQRHENWDLMQTYLSFQRLRMVGHPAFRQPSPLLLHIRSPMRQSFQPPRCHHPSPPRVHFSVFVFNGRYNASCAPA